MITDAELAQAVLDHGSYAVLATADAEGNPWPTPVWYARSGREIVWVSRPQARHSRNIADRPTIGLVVYETPVPAEGRVRAVYGEGTAREVRAADRSRCLAVFDARSRADGLGAWPVDRVTASATLRLYHAVVTHWYVLEPDRDVRREVMLDL